VTSGEAAIKEGDLQSPTKQTCGFPRRTFREAPLARPASFPNWVWERHCSRNSVSPFASTLQRFIAAESL